MIIKNELENNESSSSKYSIFQEASKIINIYQNLPLKPENSLYINTLRLKWSKSPFEEDKNSIDRSSLKTWTLKSNSSNCLKLDSK